MTQKTPLDLQAAPQLRLFEAYGVELEYMIVDNSSLDVRAVADELFHQLTGEWTSLVERGEVDLDNELAAHIVEMKNPRPTADLTRLCTLYEQQVRALSQSLQAMSCRLLPTAMHPWMDPYRELRLWPHGDASIYQALHKIFDCRGHGWANLQSTHLNLPFTGDEEFHTLHSAIRAVLPLIPTLAASSAFADGAFTGLMDKRLQTYRDNAKRVPSVAGHVIPEVCTSQKDYHTKILRPIWKDLEPYDPDGILRYEWINARGCIARFDRMSIEIRLIDIQEAPVMDMTLVTVLVELLKHLIQTGSWSRADLWSCERLKSIFEQGFSVADETVLEPDFISLFGVDSRERMKARQFWKVLSDEGIIQAKGFEKSWKVWLEHGSLARRMVQAVGKAPSHVALKNLYEQLSRCLLDAQPFIP